MCNDFVVEVCGSDGVVCEKVVRVLCEVLVIECYCDIEGDLGQGIGQIGCIVWVMIFIVKLSMGFVVYVICGLCDLLLCWCDELVEDFDVWVLLLVYEDSVLFDLVDVLELVVVVSSELCQYQSFVEVLWVFVIMVDCLLFEQCMVMVVMIECSIVIIGEYVFMCELCGVLIDVVSMLVVCGCFVVVVCVYIMFDWLGCCFNEMLFQNWDVGMVIRLYFLCELKFCVVG